MLSKNGIVDTDFSKKIIFQKNNFSKKIIFKFSKKFKMIYFIIIFYSITVICLIIKIFCFKEKRRIDNPDLNYIFDKYECIEKHDWETSKEVVKEYILFLKKKKISLADSYDFYINYQYKYGKLWLCMCTVGWIALDPYYDGDEKELDLTDKNIEKAFQKLDERRFQDWAWEIVKIKK